MSKETPNGCMLMFRGTDWCSGLSPEEMQKVADAWMTWFTGLTESGKAIAGSPLDPEGAILSGAGGRVVSDGPFAESKEAIGGYFILKVDTFEEALTIARQCPGLAYGVKVEVRPVAMQCPGAAKAGAEAHTHEEALAGKAG